MGAIGGQGSVAAARDKLGVGNNDKVFSATADVEKGECSVRGLNDTVSTVKVLPMNAQQLPPPSPLRPPPHQQHQYPQPQPQPQPHQHQHQHNDDHHQGETPREEALSVRQPSAHSSTPSTATAATTNSSSFYDAASNKHNGGRTSSGRVDKRKAGLLETVDVSGVIADWAVDNSRGGEFTAMLETIRGASGALSVDTRVVLKQGSGNGGRPQM